MIRLPESLLRLLAWRIACGDEVLIDRVAECGAFVEIADSSEAEGLLLLSTSLPITLDELRPHMLNDVMFQSALGESSLDLAVLQGLSNPLPLSPLSYYGMAVSHLGVVWPRVLRCCLKSMFLADRVVLSFSADMMSPKVSNGAVVGRLRLGATRASHAYRCCTVQIVAARSACLLLDPQNRLRIRACLREWLPSVRAWRFDVSLHPIAVVLHSGFGFLGEYSRRFHCFFEHFLR